MGLAHIGIFPSVQARLVLGVPTDVERQDGSAGQDLVHFNAHRCQVSVARFMLTDIIQDLWSTTLSLSHYQLGVYLAGTRKKANHFLLHLKISLLNMALYLVQRSRSWYDKIIKKSIC